MSKATLLLAGFLALHVGSAIASEDQASSKTIRTVDFSGHPPFKRGIKTVPTVETTNLARFEESNGEARRQRTVDFRGRPPFKRRTVTRATDVTDLARFEEETQHKKRTRRPGPPGKNIFLD